jgi:hypothetical protein
VEYSEQNLQAEIASISTGILQKYLQQREPPFFDFGGQCCEEII